MAYEKSRDTGSKKRKSLNERSACRDASRARMGHNRVITSGDPTGDSWDDTNVRIISTFHRYY